MVTQPTEEIAEKALDSEYLRKYAGKWVLVVDEHVVASGDSPQEILRKIPKKATETNSFVMKVPTPEESMLVI